MASTAFQLRRDSFSKLILTNAEGEHSPARSFPIQAPHKGTSLGATFCIRSSLRLRKSSQSSS
jgi:hypothetical protein